MMLCALCGATLAQREARAVGEQERIPLCQSCNFAYGVLSASAERRKMADEYLRYGGEIPRAD